MSLGTLFLWFQIQGLRRNIAKAKSSGFEYVVLPFHMLSIPWALTRHILLPLLDWLPTSWTEQWVPLLVLERGWPEGYDPFRRVGADTFIAVSPTQNILFTCDPEASTQFLRGKNWTKPTELLQILNIFGPTMTGTDGEETRLYRKITAPFFNHRTMQQVWNTSVRAVSSMLEVVTGDQASMHNRNLRPLLAKMTLHIVNAVCFESDPNCLDELESRRAIPKGHELSYSQSIHTVLDNFATLFLIPRPILNNSPLHSQKNARQAYDELLKYMEDLRDQKKREIKQEQGKILQTDPTLLDLIVGAGEKFDEQPEPLISPEAVLGNMFVFMFAGHEASANTIQFIILVLACNPRIQRSMQIDIDQILHNCSVEDSSYEAHFTALMESMIGAVINEVLRLYTVLPFILKAAAEDSPPIVVDGRSHVVPPGTIVLVNTSASHRNPKYWPEPQGALAGAKPHPVAVFNPSIWLKSDKATGGGPWLPKTGSFLPFSDGSRGCLGTRFSMVELCAVVTRIFQEYSVELAVKGLKPDPSEVEKKLAWEKAKTSAEYALSSGVRFEMSLRMESKLPIEFVRRGHEKFAGL
ncbi:hypothetical protein MMC30_002935 [Trapelia coarctata]|nr:hypothetical protein [Trapelia coarctata]